MNSSWELRKVLSLHLQLGFQRVFIYNVYMIMLYGVTELKGNIFDLGMAFGLAEVAGVFIGERFLNLMSDTKTMILSVGIFLCALTTI